MKIAQTLFKGYLEDDEKIIHAFHRHPIVIFKELIVIIVFGLVLPIGLWYLFPELLIISGIWVFISLIRILRVLTVWYYDSILVTTNGIVDIYWNGFFDRTSSRMEYINAGGVTTEVRKFHRVLFNYGRVAVQNAGNMDAFVLDDCMNPRKAERIITYYIEHFNQDQKFKDSETLKELLVSMLQNHANDKDNG
ncbi:hypothetical protein GF340_03550 [Candidatus Peregrinibacteria bacterium]|nr:hypothetical protein [Candidatus Peregrinibacteria bacterium]